MLAIAEKLTARLNEIKMNCLDSHLRSKAGGIIELRHFKTFIESIAPISMTANLKFDSDGVRARSSNPSTNAIVDAFLPSSLFSRYVQLGEICLPDIEKLLGMLTILSSKKIPGKVNLRIYVEPGTDSNPSQLHMISGSSEMIYLPQNYLSIEDQKFTEPILMCKVQFKGENLAKAIKQSSALSRTAKFLVSNKLFRILSADENHDKGIAKPHCEVSGYGSADSVFDIDQLLAMRHTIEKSKDVTLSLGTNQPMILDMAIDTIQIRYCIKESEPTYNL